MTVVWKLVLSFLNLPRTSWPMIVTSLTLPWSTCERNSEKLIPLSFSLEPPALTTCQSRTPDSTITSQKTTVLTVEFTENSSLMGPTQNCVQPIRCRPCQPDVEFR